MKEWEAKKKAAGRGSKGKRPILRDFGYEKAIARPKVVREDEEDGEDGSTDDEGSQDDD